jgi:Flp pilus assembly pilin Flp
MHKLYEQVSRAVARVLTISREDLKREEGQGATEYGLVIAFLVIALAATVGLLGQSIQDFLGAVGTALEGLAP